MFGAEAQDKQGEEVNGNSFLLFGGEVYYPGGGWTDYCGEFASVDEAYEAGKRDFGGNMEWFHVVDFKKRVIVTVVEPGAKYWDTDETTWKVHNGGDRLYIEEVLK